MKFIINHQYKNQYEVYELKFNTIKKIKIMYIDLIIMCSTMPMIFLKYKISLNQLKKGIGTVTLLPLPVKQWRLQRCMYL